MLAVHLFKRDTNAFRKSGMRMKALDLYIRFVFLEHLKGGKTPDTLYTTSLT